MTVATQANSVPADVPTLSDKKKQTVATAQSTDAPEKPAVTLPRDRQSKQRTAAAVQQNGNPQQVAGPAAKLNAAKQATVAAAKTADNQQKQPASTKQIIPATWYMVKNGDSLTAIAKKFQVSTQDLRQWNNLSGDNLKTGNKLLVKKG
jgi:membrane-bound lytic murein transglycosylase D